MMTFEQFIHSEGGVAKVAAKAKSRRKSVSQAHLYNIIARRKRVSANLVRKLRPLFPEVPAEVWLEWLTASGARA